MLDHPRNLLLVFGKVTRDAEGRPLSIDDVDHIEPIDLTSLHIGPVAAGDETLVPTEAIVATVLFDETKTVYVAEIPSLAVSVFAETREMPILALEDEVALVWKRYAAVPDEKLTRTRA